MPLVEPGGQGPMRSPDGPVLSRLGLEVSLVAGTAGSQGESTVVQLTPVREGVSRPWIRRGAAWRDLVSGYSSPDVLPEAVEMVLGQVPPSNPRPVDRDALTALLHAAWAGDPPTEDAQPV